MKQIEVETEIFNCRSIINEGGIILYPTDTIWGIGCDACNENAVKKIYAIKQRTESKSLIVLIDSAEKLGKYVRQVPDFAWDFIEFSEKPLTIVYPGAVNLAKNVVADDGSVAIRVVKHEFCRQLILKSGKPLVSTSANFSGSPAPARFSEIDSQIISQVDYVVNLPAEKNRIGSPSMIIKLGLSGEIDFLRK